MSWTPLPWQQERWQRLQAAASAGRLAHAMLFAGPRGIGKAHLAMGLAYELLCEGTGRKRPCGECRGCVQLAAGTHPNVFRVTVPEDKKEIPVDALRELGASLSLSSHYGRPKIAVIDPADAMNFNGMNSVLKLIEEPPPATYLVLIAEAWRQLPPTLRSRCQIVRFGAVPSEQAATWLKQQHPKMSAAALARAARQPLRAEALLEAAEGEGDWSSALAQLAEGRLEPLRLAERLKREQAQAALESILETASGWLWQKQSARRGVPPRASPAALLQLLDDAVEGLRALDRNGNPALIMESLMIRWASGSRDAPSGTGPSARTRA